MEAIISEFRSVYPEYSNSCEYVEHISKVVNSEDPPNALGASILSIVKKYFRGHLASFHLQPNAEILTLKIQATSAFMFFLAEKKKIATSFANGNDCSMLINSIFGRSL